MKSNRSSLLYVLLAVIFSLLLPGAAIAAKKKNQNIQPIISAVSNDGSDKIYGSVLNPKEDEINVLLQSLLYILKKGDLSKLSFVLHSALDSSKSYTIPKDAISIQRKKLNKKYDKYLVVNLFNLKTPAGISVSPSSLPKDNYKLRLISSDSEIVSNPINYETPILIVGNSKKSGLVTVEDENGNNLSEHTVATNSDGIFFTEVRANKLSSQNESRRFLKSQDINNENTADTSLSEQTSEIKTGFVHVTADKDLYAVVPLDNDAKNNDSKAKKPIEVDEGSTLAANLAKNNKDLADEVAKDELASIESEEETPVITEPEDINCDISKFANRCKNADDVIYTSVGTDFREFLESNTCNFSEWQLIKQVILASPESTNIYTGKGYCEYIEREINDNKPCEKYSQVLADYKSGLTKQLPCPPDSCNEFSYIKPPRCFTNEGFCNENSPTNDEFGLGGICRGQDCLKTNTKTCIHKPIKDLFCAKIGDIDPSECKDDPSSGLAPVGWTIATNSFGNQYCVSPTYQYSYSKSLTLQEIADLCELNTCHNNCSKQFGAVQPGIVQKNNEELTDCHLTCEANAGRYFDCTKSQSKFFSIKCCYNTTSQQGSFGQQVPPIQFNSSDFGPQKGPIPLDIRSCLCESPSNFNKNGLVNENAQYDCKDKCPQGYEKDPNSDSCLPVCREGTVRDPAGVCRKKCPPGSLQDNFGNCSCPSDQIFGRSGKCENSSCPEYCKNYPLVRKFLVSHDLTSIANSNPIPTFTSLGNSNPSGFGTTNFGSTSIPSECQHCLGGTTTTCGTDQYLDGSGICRCNSDGSVATSIGPEGCKKQNYNCGSNMLPNNVPGEAQCICPSGLPYWDNNTNSCVATCPNGNPPASASTNLLPKSPISCNNSSTTRPCVSGEGPSNNCYCFGGGYTGTDGKCQCSGGVTYTGAGCGTTFNYCAPAISTTTGCTCAPGATPSGPNSTCQCPNNNTPAYTAAGCGGTTTRPCTAGEGPSNNCYCFGSGWFVSSDGKCQCSGGQQYTGGGCGTSSTNYCSPGITVGTNGCTCNPSAGGYSLNGYCTCPTNSGPYTKETGCTSSQFTCPVPYIKDPAFPQSCTCPLGTPYELGTTCVASCPAGLTPTTTPGTAYSSTKQSCKCPDGTYPNTQGTCFTSTCPAATPIKCSDGTCKLTQAECSSSTTCPPATPIKCSDGTCAVTQASCPCPSTTPVKCSDGTCAVSAANCSSTVTCSAPYIKDPANSSYCTCPSSTPIAHYSSCLTTCPTGLVATTQPGTMKCPTCSSYQVCLCPDGSYPNSNGTCSSTQGSLSLTSAVLNGANLLVTFSASLPNDGSCAYLKDINGVVLYSLFCGSTTGTTVTAPISTFLHTVVAGDQVKICKSNDSTVCSSFISVTNTVTDSVNLSSVTLNGNDVTVTFTGTSPSQCFVFKDVNGLFKGTICGNNSVTISASVLQDAVTAFVRQVSLCSNDNRSVCSGPVTVTGPSYCQAEAQATSCSCAPPATIDSTTNKCKCPAGSLYYTNYLVTNCLRYCNVGETISFSSGSPSCACGTHGNSSPTGCSCDNGATYSSQNGCGADSHI